MQQAELQHELQRFSGQFIDHLTQAMEPLLRSHEPRVRDAAMRRELNYIVATFDIVSAPAPEVNLLDFLLFARLSRLALERYWIPRYFGQLGQPAVAPFLWLEDELWMCAARVVGPMGKNDFEEIVQEWLTEHPDLVRVEAVRLSEFSAHKSEGAKKARGLLAGLKSATRAADHALLLGDRAMFLATRMPFVIRMQARLGAQEIVDDTLKRLSPRRLIPALGAGALVASGLWLVHELLGRKQRLLLP